MAKIRGIRPEDLNYKQLRPTGSDRRGMVGVILGIGASEDGRLLGAHPTLGGVALIGDAQGGQRTTLRILCETNGVCRPIEVADDACFSAWFGPNITHPNRPSYAAIVADLIQSGETCSALAGSASGEAGRGCQRFARALGLYTFCALGICLPPEFVQASGVGEFRAAGGIPPVYGTNTCCRWLQDLANAGLIGEAVFGAGPAISTDPVSAAIGGLVGGLAALFVLNDDESEWCPCRGQENPDAVLEGTVGEVANGLGWPGSAGNLPVFFPSQDNPFTHDTLDFNLDVVAFAAGEAWPGSPNYRALAGLLNPDGGTALECEWESGFLPCFAWPCHRARLRLAG